MAESSLLRVTSCVCSAVPLAGLRFYAYNVLAGGLLTGKHAARFKAERAGIAQQGGKGAGQSRFAGCGNSKTYRARFWKQSYFEALEAVAAACAAEGVPMAAAAVRWLTRHSALDGARGDAVILGATKPGHLAANLEAATGKGACGPLSAGVVAAFDAAWGACRHEVPCYFR